MNEVTKYPDLAQKYMAQVAAQIASQNPCATRAQLMELVAEAVAEGIKGQMTKRSPTPEEASENRRRWLKETKHDALYSLEKTLSTSENSDA